MKCPRCDVDMRMGIAIDPVYDDNEFHILGRRPIPADEVKLLNVFKCPECGHSDDGKIAAEWGVELPYDAKNEGIDVEDEMLAVMALPTGLTSQDT